MTQHKGADFLKRAITTIADYPKPGIQFRDITSLLEDPAAFRAASLSLSEMFADTSCNKIVAIEARGFIFGALLANALGLGLVLARKPGKLPRETYSHSYELEYGQDTLHVHCDALRSGDRLLLIDDLIATGGTAQAVVELASKAGARVTQAGFIIALPELGGVSRLKQCNINVRYLVEYDGE